MTYEENVQVWPSSAVETFYVAGYPSDEQYEGTWPCHVRISDERIELRYEGDDGLEVEWIGQDLGGGHYVLNGPDGGKAVFHRFAGSKILDGYWEEKPARGMWRVILGSQSEETD